MSLERFQETMVRLIVDPDYRDRIADGREARDEGLTERETARLRRIAADPGLDINRTLHKGFRLGKLRGPPPEQHVRFRHDPTALLTALAQGRRPRGIPERPCTLVARRDTDGKTIWSAHGTEPTTSS